MRNDRSTKNQLQVDFAWTVTFAMTNQPDKTVHPFNLMLVTVAITGFIFHVNSDWLSERRTYLCSYRRKSIQWFSS